MKLSPCLALLTLLSVLPSAHAADRDVIINEIMYHPTDDRETLQFVELFNRGADPVDISQWTLKGAKFTFPPNTKLEPGAFLVLCRSTTNFAGHYGQDLPTIGNFEGNLSHRSERLELLNAQKSPIDGLKYSDRAPWPLAPDGYSSSLERICPESPSDQPSNWAPSKLPRTKRTAGTPGRTNDVYSASLPPIIDQVEFNPKSPLPNQKTTVSASVSSVAGIKTVALLYRLASPRSETAEREVIMERTGGPESGSRYQATIDGQPEASLVRFRIKATDAKGIERIQPSENEPRPAYSYYVLTPTNTALVPFGYIVQVGPAALPGGSSRTRPNNRQPRGSPALGNGAFIYLPPNSTEVHTYDFVHVRPRSGGLKVHFLKDQTLRDMTAINLIFEGAPRWVLSEPLSYELYRMAGVPAELTDHVRLWHNGRLLGYHLLVEQPNRGFLARNKRDDTGNLYKLLWYGQGIVGQHEKKTNPRTGHAELVQLIEGLNQKSGAQQWEFIKKHFNVEEFANYFAVNMCIQNWDGFFNNYLTYHDINGTGKWEIYPWDEDKTWGDHDGASPSYDWYGLPLTYAMNSDRSPRDLFGRMGQGPFGGVSWWRPPGYFSGPLLANPEFRKQFLTRLREICQTVFTPEKFAPVIRNLETRLIPEVQVRALASRQDPEAALDLFSQHIKSFHNQLLHRRKFILAELDKIK